MKAALGKYAFRSIIFGIVMTVLVFFGGGVRYEFDETVSFAPVWLQLLQVFVISMVISLVLYALADALMRKIRKR